jgi:hypothetical protein
MFIVDRFETSKTHMVAAQFPQFIIALATPFAGRANATNLSFARIRIIVPLPFYSIAAIAELAKWHWVE